MMNYKITMLLIAVVALAGSVQAGPDEDKVLAELNLARTQPKKYAAFVEQHKGRFIDDNVFNMPGRGRIRTQEGKSAVDEAIAFLKKVKPVGKLTMSKGLSKAAADHTKDIGKTGKTGHTGSDGSSSSDRMERHGKWKKTCGENVAFGPGTARAIVMQLIIDDGVANRGHRTNIYKPEYKVVGLAVGPHAKYGKMCCQDFAGGFADKR